MIHGFNEFPKGLVLTKFGTILLLSIFVVVSVGTDSITISWEQAATKCGFLVRYQLFEGTCKFHIFLYFITQCFEVGRTQTWLLLQNVLLRVLCVVKYRYHITDAMKMLNSKANTGTSGCVWWFNDRPLCIYNFVWKFDSRIQTFLNVSHICTWDTDHSYIKKLIHEYGCL